MVGSYPQDLEQRSVASIVRSGVDCGRPRHPPLWRSDGRVAVVRWMHREGSVRREAAVRSSKRRAVERNQSRGVVLGLGSQSWVASRGSGNRTSPHFWRRSFAASSAPQARRQAVADELNDRDAGSASRWRRVEPRRDKSNVSRHPGSGELASSSPVFAWIFADQVAPIVRVGAENERELVRFHFCVSEASAIVSALTRSMNALSRFALWTSSRSWRWRPSP